MNIFLKWWLMVTLIVVGISTSIYFNFDTFLFENDLTKLSLVIVSLFVICTSVIGYKIWNSAIQRKKIYDYQTE